MSAVFLYSLADLRHAVISRGVYVSIRQHCRLLRPLRDCCFTSLHFRSENRETEIVSSV